MAMQFNLPPAGTTLNANTALENLRLGYMVDRFTGLAINRTIAGQAAHQSTVIGDVNEVHLTVGGVRNITTPGSYHISDRVITMGTGALLATADGVHISFYNCTFVVTDYTTTANVDHRFAFGITALATNTGTTNRAASARVGDGVNSTRSINFYGCTVNVTTQGDRSLLRCQIADSIGSDFRFLGEGASGADLGLLPSPQNGGRWINSTFVAGQQRSGIAFLETYGFPDVFEGVELYGLGMNNGLEASSSGPRMLVEPNFTLLGQTNVFVTQGTAGTSATATNFNNAAQIAQNVGFFTPPDNDDNTDGDVIGAGAGTEAAYVHIANGGGGAINYAAYQPTYRDAISGAGIQNVKVRVNTSITLNNNNATVASTFHSKLTQPGTTQTVTGNFIGNEYLTNTNGQLASSQYTLNGWTNSIAGYFDPLEFNVRTAVGSNQLAENTLTRTNLTPPANTALAVIQDIRGNGTNQNFSRHEAQYEAFSWSHDILQELSENSTTLFDDSTRATSTSYGINRDLSVTAPNVVGTLVKESVTNSDNTPNLTALQGFFDQDDVPSINDVRMVARYARYQFETTGNPQTDSISLLVSNSFSQPWIVSGNVVEVRGAGLTAKTDDLFTADANLGSVNMGGHPITGLTLGNSRTSWANLVHSDTLPAATNSTLNGIYVPVGTTVDVTFNECNLSGLELNPIPGQTINVRGTDTNTGVSRPISRESFAGIGPSGTVNFPQPVFTLTVTTPDEPGYFGVRNVTQGTVVKLPGTPVGENAIITGSGNPGSFEIPEDNRTDTFRFYWKAANTATTGYSTTIIEGTNAGLTMSMMTPMTATPLIATLYSGDARLGKANVADPSSSSRAAGNNGMQILVNNNAITNGAESQYHILSAMDWVQYIDVLTENNLTSDLINPDTISSTVSDAAYIQFNTATAGEQQQLVGAQFTNVNGIDNMLYDRESFANTNFAFVDNINTLTDEDRFFIRDRTDNSLLPATGNSARWPGVTGSAIQILDADLVAVDVDDDSALATFLQALETRGFELADVRGQIQPRDSGGIQRADFNFQGITRTRTDTGTEYTFTLTAVNRPNTSTAILDTIGFASGTRGTMLGGNTLTGAQSDQVVQISGTGFSFPSVTLFPNPAGATPAQIQQAAETAINSSTSIAQTRNGVGYLIGTGGDSRLVGIKPRATNYDSTQPYGDNL